LKQKWTALRDAATDLSRELLKSKEQKEAEEQERIVDGAGAAADEEANPALMKFKAALESTIDLKFAEIMRGKTDTHRHLTYADGQVLTGTVRNVFKNALGTTPRQVEAACNLSEAVLAPSAGERRKRLRAAVGFGGGATGIALIIAAVASALGWGAGVISIIIAFIMGTSLTGPIGIAVGGLTLAGVSVYFATTSDFEVDTERFMKALKGSSARAVDAVWPKHGEALSGALASRPGS
jgi:hypothetical protein